MCEALTTDIVLRGAITLGDAVLDNTTNTYIGKPIVEAHNLERCQHWVGLALGNSAVWPPFLTQLHGSSVIEYPPPMKPGSEQYASPVVVDWPRRWRDRKEVDLGDKLDTLNKKPRYSKYYDNAKKFADFSRSKRDWFKHPESISPDAFLRLVTPSEAQFA